MISKFKTEFAVDQNTIIAEVRALRCQDQDVTKYTEEFNLKISKLRSTNPGTQEHLKILYVDGLPFKLKEMILRDRHYQFMDLTSAQAEAKRQHSVNVYMNRGKKPGEQNNNNNDDKNQNQNQG